MSYTDLRDFHAEFTGRFTTDEGDKIVIQVEKLGGGTVGRDYTGAWRYIVTCDGVEVTRGQDFVSGRPMCHADVAEAIDDMLCKEI